MLWSNYFMKNSVIFLVAMLCFFCCYLTHSHAQGIGSIDEVNHLIRIRDCAGAEVYARNNFQRPLLHTIFGMIYLDCRQNRKTAVDYFRIAARENESTAIEMLMSIGENTTEFGNNTTYRSPPPDYMAPQIENPPAHIFTPPPQPHQRRQPQVIIIHPLPNPAACIQDGGSTFCPYYRR